MFVDILIYLNVHDEVETSIYTLEFPINSTRDLFAELDYNFLNNGRIGFLFFCAIHNVVAKVTTHL